MRQLKDCLVHCAAAIIISTSVPACAPKPTHSSDTVPSSPTITITPSYRPRESQIHTPSYDFQSQTFIVRGQSLRLTTRLPRNPNILAAPGQGTIYLIAITNSEGNIVDARWAIDSQSNGVNIQNVAIDTQKPSLRITFDQDDRPAIIPFDPVTEQSRPVSNPNFSL